MKLRLIQLTGLTHYADALKLMQMLTEPSLILLQHEPVYTAGRREHHGKFGNLPHPMVMADRGGQVTWHGPGQLVAYPCFNLRHLNPSLHWYVDRLEQVMRNLMHDYGIKTSASGCERGVWTEWGGKIGFVGIRNRGWFVSHGIALNVNNSLEPFKHIIPCGQPNAKITSMSAELERTMEIEEVKLRLIAHFEGILNIKT